MTNDERAVELWRIPPGARCSAVAKSLDEAERRGAERMRAEAEKIIRQHADVRYETSRRDAGISLDHVASLVSALLLPGDEGERE